MKANNILPPPRISKLIALASLLMPIFAFAQDVDPNDYYYIDGNKKNAPKETGDKAPWRLSDGSYVTQVVNSSTNLIFSTNSAAQMNFFGVAQFNSLLIENSGAGTYFNLNPNDKVSTINDQIYSLSSTNKTVFSAGISQGGMSGTTSGIVAGGNIVLETEKYLNLVLRADTTYDLNQVYTAGKNLGTQIIKTDKQLTMSALNDDALVRIILAEGYYGALWGHEGSYLVTNKEVNSNVIVSGLEGSGAFSFSKYVSGNGTITFQKNSEGNFLGGTWTGTNSIFGIYSYSEVEVTDSITDKEKAANFYVEQSKTTTQKITYLMNSDDEVNKQTINLKKSANFNANTATEADISDINIENQTGYMVFNSDVKLNEVNVYDGKLDLVANEGINSLTLSVGKLNLTTDSIGTLTFDYGDGVGEYVYNGEIAVDALNVFAENVYIIFDAEDLESNSLVVVSYGELDMDTSMVDSIFIAKDENGNDIAGSFYLNESASGGSLVFAAVPEPATIAGILGLIALAFAIRRRK